MGPRMQGNGAGDKMCTRCGWTPDVCKVIQHVASAEAALGSFATRVSLPNSCQVSGGGGRTWCLPSSLKTIEKD